MSDDAKAALQRGDAAAALRMLQEPARRGDPKAQHGLAFLYFQGRGVAANQGEAIGWLRRAAEQGYAPAEFDLGITYRDGIGTRPDDAAAFAWWKKAADHGFAPAQHNVGSRYLNGRTVAQSDTEAARWFAKAAEQGWANSLFVLGMLTAEGRGTTKDPVRAYMLMILAEDGIQDAKARADLLNRRTALAATMSEAQIADALGAVRRWTPKGGEPEPGYVKGPGSVLGAPAFAPGQPYDVGSFLVTAPGGIPWQVEREPGGTSVTFMRAGSRDALALIGVGQESLDDEAIASTEAEVAARLQATMMSSFERRGPSRLYTTRVAGRDVVTIGGKALHRVVLEIEDRSTGLLFATKVSIYVLVPADWKVARKAYVFHFEQEAQYAARDPLPAEQVIASLRIK